jgi:hypothetical protein
MITQNETSTNQKKDASTEQLSQLIREYKQSRWVANSEKIGKPDSLSASFTIEDLERFIEEAKANGGDNIKFYFAAYPEHYADVPEYAGRQTIVPVATRNCINASGTLAVKDIYVPKDGQLKVFTAGSVPYLCPPFCKPPSEGGMGDLGITLVDLGDKGMEII